MVRGLRLVLDELAARVQSVEVRTSKSTMEVLAVAEKVTRQLVQRERWRARHQDDDSTSESGDGDGAPEQAPEALPAPTDSSTAHLARRFRIGG